MSGGAGATKNGLAKIFALYRSILRIHRNKLPIPVREMGDRYVREEFASHLKSNTTTEAQWKSFFQEWQRYHGMLAGAADLTTPDGLILDQGETLITGIDRSGDISEDIIKSMTPEQVERLQSIRKEAVKFGQEMISSGKKSSSAPSSSSSS
jgi:Complex1_LYR-like